MRNGDRGLAWGLAAVLAIGLGIVGQEAEERREVEQVQAVTTAVPTECLALAVLTAAADGDWLEQAMIVQTISNAAARDQVDACAAARQMAAFAADGPFKRSPTENTAQWYQAREVVRAVTTGDYTIAPVLCSWATDFTRRDEATPDADRESCEVGRYVFLLDPVPLSGTPAYAGQQLGTGGVDDWHAAAVRVAATFPGED
ncbi:hypothetical protein [uncultured Arenimonas sp.]|uniref:hypothetical protein n=1 Tax=uncultured Arenimonas sp. TaxID=546226 RepID=UPI0030DB7599